MQTLLEEKKFITVGRDVTARKQTDEELIKHRDNLKELVAEQINDLQKINVELRAEISERKRAEESLAFERAQLLSIFDSIDDGVYISDIETHEIVYSSPS